MSKRIAEAAGAIRRGEGVGKAGMLLALVLVDVVAKSELERTSPPSPRSVQSKRREGRTLATLALELFAAEKDRAA